MGRLDAFWSGNPSGTAADYKARFPNGAAAVLAKAEEICDQTFLFSDHWEMERTQEPVRFEGEIDWAHIPFGDVEWLYALNRHSCFVHLGKAYLLTGEERYAGCYARLIKDWIDRVPLTELSSQTTWRSLEAGLRCETWLRALKFFEKSPALTAGLRAKIEDSLMVHRNYLVQASGNFQRLSNWGVLQDHGLLLLGVYFGQQENIRLAAQRLDSQLHLQIFRDGSHWEQSPMYHCEVLHCALDALLIARQNGVELSSRFQSNAYAMCGALAAWIKPDGHLICQSDSDDTDARDLLAMGALLFSDGRLKYAADSKIFEETVWDFPAEALEGYAAITAQAPECFSTALPDSGNYVLRAGAGSGAPWLHMHCGCLGSGHGHGDLLHVDVGAYGEDILIDSGRYTYVDSLIRHQLKQPAAHNTVTVDGTDFCACADSWVYSKLAMPIKGEFTFTNGADYISGMHMGYWDLPGGGVLTGRKVLFIKPDIFILFDQFYGKGIHRYDAFFHFAPGDLDLMGNRAVWRGKKAAASMCFLGDINVEKERAPFSRDYNALCEGDVLHAAKQARDFSALVTVAAVAKADDSFHGFEVRSLPVTMVRAQKTLSEEQAQAVCIKISGRTYTVLVVNNELISGVDLLQAGSYTGYGKAVVFHPEAPEGICLAW